ncbi:MAG: hypothetical protein ACI8RD_006276 [Bacillariaceae sp.]|jgi:hypothetical protein
MNTMNSASSDSLSLNQDHLVGAIVIIGTFSSIFHLGLTMSGL